MTGYQMVEKVYDRFSRLDNTGVWQTDGRTDTLQ